MLGLAAALACPGLAHASAARPTVEVRWTAPSSCGPAQLTTSLDALLAGSEVEARVEVDAIVVQEADGWRVDAWFHIAPDRDGQRTFHAPACATVSHAAALAVAIAVDPTVLDRVDPQQPPPELTPLDASPPEAPEEQAPEEQAPSSPIPLVADASSPTVDDEIVAIEPIAAADAEPSPGSEPWRLVLGAGARVDALALPGPGFGGTLGLGVIRRRLRADLLGSLRAPTREATTGEQDSGGRFHQWSVGGRGCFVPRAGPVELPLCAGMEAGQVIGRGYGWRHLQTARLPWLAATASAGATLPLGRRLAAVAQAEAAVPLLRPDFAVEGVGSVLRVGAAQVRGLVGVELRLP